MIAFPIKPSSQVTTRSSARCANAAKDERGFTLMELLTVLLIIGVLAAIAIPSFIGQTARASDAAAKTQIGTLQTAMKEFAMDNSGSYKGATLAKLAAIEPTLRDTTTAVAKEVAGATATDFEIESEAVGSNHVYKLVSSNGEVTRSCTPAGAGGCKGGSW
ncbi:MAG TPA: prepilin-type N-terminal cleavage/methylation domain-containing protein [Solirubrobacteraceae bacterium]|nr:prepilin-type N-terminal cleavage/methylation domain-containing protein [Solirubrobacteraceae bacterium]